MLWISLVMVILLFYRPKIFAVLILVFGLGLVASSFYYDYTYVPPRDAYIEENKLIILGQQNPQFGPGIFAESVSSYFLLNPANYYEIAKDNNCPGFNHLNKQTWCGDEGQLPSCYPEDQKCSSIILMDEDGNF